MPVHRGDVVIVDIEQGPGMPLKRRPAVVVQSNTYNQRLVTAMVAQITRTTKFAQGDAAQVLWTFPRPTGCKPV